MTRFRQALSGFLPRGQTLPYADWSRRHRAVIALLAAHAVALPLLGLALGSGLLRAGGYFALLTGIAAISALPGLTRDVRSAVAAGGLVVCSSVLVQITHGAIEAHFHFFVMVPIVAMYEDWLPFGLAVGYVLLEHGVIGTIAPHAVYDHASANQHPWAWAAVHTGFFAAACAGSLANWRFAENSRLGQQKLAQSMRHQARHDPLTGLPNRAMLVEAGHQMLLDAIGSGSPMSVLMIDLDRFKEVNDTLGHNWGDALLVQVGQRLDGVSRGSDLLVRVGGDEFAVLLPDSDAPAAARVAQRMVSRMTATFEIAGLRLDVDASIGSATWLPSAGPDRAPRTDVEVAFADLLRQADIAMYAAKHQGSGVRSYLSVEDSTSIDRLTGLTDLRRALESDEIVLHYQPKIRLSDGAVIGAEALARWAHPTRGLLGPAEFISLAEHSPLVVPLTERVLDLAVGQARALFDAGRPTEIAVNISPRSLHERDFARLVLGTLERHRLPANLLRLEVTETSLMSDADVAARVLAELGRQGLGLSIDDFGTGYSSMTHLRQLPVDELKIDRSFVMGLPTDDEDLVIIRSSIQLAHSLGLSVVAEGIEHAEAMQILADLGCDNGQGFHIARPMPADELAAWIAAAADRAFSPPYIA